LAPPAERIRMRLVIDFLLALAITAAGSINPTFPMLQLVTGGELNALEIFSASLMLWIGAHWLWTDFIAVSER
jgi:hypothetical protein